MRIVLVNPNWNFAGSIYFGCREPHLPLEFGYAKALLERAGHVADIVDAQLCDLDEDAMRRRVGNDNDLIVVTTAPSYLFWRCPPPELSVPMRVLKALRNLPGAKIIVGPHGSTTPKAVLRKLGADAVVIGECEQTLLRLADTPRDSWSAIDGLCHRRGGLTISRGGPQAVDMAQLPALSWPASYLQRHHHHHHRFDAAPDGPGAEMEVSRGCPYHCTFCAKDNFRDSYRRRPLQVILEELDGLRAAGIRYVYFIDEIFLPWRELLEAFVSRGFSFGVQTRIDLWNPEMLELLGRAGCVSIEAGIESLSPEGRERLAKRCKLTTEELGDRLIIAKRHVPFVQANLIEAGTDRVGDVERWRDRLRRRGVWANAPVPLFPYPGSPDYTRLWGAPDDQAWERAVDHYLECHVTFSDIQDARPRRLAELESVGSSL